MVKIEVPMYAVSKQAGTTASPYTVIPGNCGTAFLYVSRVGHDEAHVDFGFEYLTDSALWVSGHVGMINLDGSGTAYASWSGPTSYVSSWEKQTNLYASPAVSGTYQVTAYIHTTGVFFDCTSSPAFWQDLYLY